MLARDMCLKKMELLLDTSTTTQRGGTDVS